MAEYIYWLKNITQSDRAVVGGKAANLGDLYRGLRSPEGFCVSTKAYSEHLTCSGIGSKITSLVDNFQLGDLSSTDRLSAEVSEMIVGAPLIPALENAIRDAYRDLAHGRQELKVAVRSSANAEDLAYASFAGQLESFLNVDGVNAVLQAVKNCWASLWTARAIHYRTIKGFDHQAVTMAVIIQEMIPAAAAGVIFTANPVNNVRNEIRIEAVRGLGEQLVSGYTAGDVYTFRKNDVNVEEISRTVSNPGQGPVINDYDLRELAHSAIKIERFFGTYQDIEWAYHQGKFYYLQTRPISTLADEELTEIIPAQKNPYQQEVMEWIAERFPEPIYPIDGVVVKILFTAQFEAMEAYGFKISDTDWTRIENGIFPEFFIPPVIRTSGSRYWQYLNIRRILKSDPAADWSKEQVHLLDMLKRLKKRDISQLPLEIIFEYITEALTHLHFFIVMRYSYFAQNRITSGILFNLLRILFKNDVRHIYESLLAGVDNITIEINDGLRNLAREAAGDPSVRMIFLQSPPEKIRVMLESAKIGEGFLKKFDEFLDRYGDRETSMGLGGIASVTWKEASEVVFGIIRSLLDEEPGAYAAREETRSRRVREAEERLSRKLSGGVFTVLRLKPLFNKLLRHARSFTAFRENSHYDITRGLHVFRILFNELGQRFVRRGLLKNTEDIFYLTYYEIKNIIMTIYHGVEDVDLKALNRQIDERKAAQEGRNIRWQRRNVQLNEEDALRGVPASVGVVSGPVRIVRGPWEFFRVQKGDIIVAPYSNPAWTPLFSTAAGVVVETGGAASHAAIVAREYGIPSVMGVTKACEMLQDGEQVTINGSTGIIYREDKQVEM